MMQAHAAERGFSIVEPLVAAVIASFALLGLSSLQATWAQEANLALQRTQATAWAHAHLERRRLHGVVANSNGDDSTAMGSGTTFTRHWSSTLVDPAVDPPLDRATTLVATQVTVTWVDRQGTTHSTQRTHLDLPQNPSLVAVIAVPREATRWMPWRPGS